MSSPRTLHQAVPPRMAGAPLASASAAVILVHGRGGSAEDILGLGVAVADSTVALIALQAVNNSWYPERFMAPLAANEPWLSSALQAVGDAVALAAQAGIPTRRTILLGFSQGACLSLEYAARHAARYGAVIGLAGGLIGPAGTPRDYIGEFAGTPVFLGCGDRDPHIPVSRVNETAAVLTTLGATVDARIYSKLGHTVVEDEIDAVRTLIRQAAGG